MGIMYSESLFKRHSTGQVGDWAITVEANGDGTATMIRRACKVIGGQPVETVSHFTEGKNLGRANETTPVEQAVKEAAARYAKQLDKGYVVDLADTNVVATNGLGLRKPMLAQPTEKVRSWHFPVYVQPKLDGHRMLATVQDSRVVLYSRQGKYIKLAHIEMALQRMFDSGQWDGTTLDGEVYQHGETLQRISSLVKKPKPESEKLVYHVYDIMLPLTYAQRFNAIPQPHSSLPVVVLSTQIVTDERSINELHAKNIGRGYEGTILRWGTAPYEEGKRSSSLMKKKDFQDAEFEVIRVERGAPNIRGELTYQVPIYVCRTSTGKIFNVTAPGTMEEKHNQWVQRDEAPGQKLTVKFFNYTPDGIPFHPVALRFREDI